MTTITTQQLLQLAITKAYKTWSLSELTTINMSLYKQLSHNKYVILNIQNGTLSHDFILYHNTPTTILKIEHYPPFYISCISSGNNWHNELTALLRANNGSQRLILWNTIFSAREQQDNDNPLYISIYLRVTKFKRSNTTGTDNNRSILLGIHRQKYAHRMTF